MSVEKLYRGNDHRVTLADLQDASGDPVTTATVSWALTTTTGTEVATGDLAGDGQGNYEGTIEASDFSGQAVGIVLLRTVVAIASGRDAEWSTPVVVSYRR